MAEILASIGLVFKQGIVWIGDVISVFTENPILFFGLAIGLVPAIILLVKKLVRAH